MDKVSFRRAAKEKRSLLFDTSEKKAAADNSIFESFMSSGLLDNVSLVLTYVSFRDEADTLHIIDRLLSDGFEVGVPVCGKQGSMDFYLIKSRDELIISAMGISEPQKNEKKLITRFDSTLCIVPGMAFDRSGNRTGYGGGYYDRFLAAHTEITTAGLCYHSLLYDSVPSEQHDMSVDYIITEKGLLKIHG
ncbi:MAG: 5-formyltetrahydrofolate cyclo-ligase [Ruminococcus sp.]|nr:5-formyltetrahydrofolate cyclo-ligase [Ruminococcus sp.]